MNKIVTLAFLLICQYQLIAQKNESGFKKGYLLKGLDTISCEIDYGSKGKMSHGYPKAKLENDEFNIYNTGMFSGFGYEDDGKWYHFGEVTVGVKLGTQQRENKFFLKKLVAGTIDLYEYSYVIGTTTTTKIDGVEKPGSATSTRQEFTNYYIGKNDTANAALLKPILISSFRKKDIEPYVADNADMTSNLNKKYKLKELIVLLNEYNLWFEKNMKK